MKSEEFVIQCLDHYSAKLAEETDRFGVTFVNHEFIDTEETFLPEMAVWQALSEAYRKYYTPVFTESGDFLLIVSESEIRRPKEHAELWLMVREIRRQTNLDDAIESLDLYDGPYKLEVPEELISGL